MRVRRRPPCATCCSSGCPPTSWSRGLTTLPPLLSLPQLQTTRSASLFLFPVDKLLKLLKKLFDRPLKSHGHRKVWKGFESFKTFWLGSSQLETICVLGDHVEVHEFVAFHVLWVRGCFNWWTQRRSIRGPRGHSKTSLLRQRIPARGALPHERTSVASQYERQVCHLLMDLVIFVSKTLIVTRLSCSERSRAYSISSTAEKAWIFGTVYGGPTSSDVAESCSTTNIATSSVWDDTRVDYRNIGSYISSMF